MACPCGVSFLNAYHKWFLIWSPTVQHCQTMLRCSIFIDAPRWGDSYIFYSATCYLGLFKWHLKVNELESQSLKYIIFFLSHILDKFHVLCFGNYSWILPFHHLKLCFVPYFLNVCHKIVGVKLKFKLSSFASEINVVAPLSIHA